MSDDFIRAKGYGVYKKLLIKALNLLVTTLVNSIVIDEDEWEGKIALRIVVKNGRLKSKNVRLTVEPVSKTIDIIEGPLDLDTTITVNTDLKMLETGTFETVIHNINDSNS